MTVATSGTGGDLAGYDPNENLGFEDVDQSDIVIPRLTIVHTEGVFKDSLSGAEYATLDVVMLGQVKQRIMWAADTDDGDRPLCKSPDHENGFPSVSEEIPLSKRFPFKSSGLKMADFPAAQGMNGLVTLPCSSCQHKEWENPLAPQKKPMCDEQFTFPIMYDPDGDGTWVTALFSVQRTGIKPAKAYVSTYHQRKTPMFRNVTKLSLNMQTKGTVTYCIPRFAQGPETDRAQWDEFANQLRSARELIRMPPENFDEEPTDGDNENVAPPVATTPSKPVARPAKAAPAPAPASAPAPVVHSPAPVAAPVEDEDDDGDDDLPF